MTGERCLTVIAGILGDHIFNHISFIAESLSILLPNFHYKNICKSSNEWKAHNVKKQKCKDLAIQEIYRQIMIIGAGRSMCSDLVPQLLMTKELWLTHGIVINLYDEPGCFFKLRRILKDAATIGAGLNTVNIVENIPDGLKDCNILIYLDSLPREENEGTDSWLERNYKSMENLSRQVNEYAPSHMKIIFCSMSLPCFYANVMHELVTKLPNTNIVVVSAHYGLSKIHSTFMYMCVYIYYVLNSIIGINHFVDVYHMVQMCNVYHPTKRALNLNKNSVLPLGTEHSELRWFFYMTYNRNAYKTFLKRKALVQYQVGRSEDFPKCRAICDLLKLWYRKNEEIGDEIIPLGIASDGSFGIPKGLVFSQPVYLKTLEDGSRIWVPYADFPMPNMPIFIFQSLVDTGIYIKRKITEL
ncbi:PREDICTED: LOW QUALITY PROTEIN: malate dehydrogenase, cytoplasmic-like, partial [Habropoda laboriosa]|uniref:LOW QUALITY PROTEIN: malate dehydrogenase, cytoplasmic-like n=1 Tax=Habropoda laboriosa TaxID=597456 RepID=UPI00083DAA3D